MMKVERYIGEENWEDQDQLDVGVLDGLDVCNIKDGNFRVCVKFEIKDNVQRVYFLRLIDGFEQFLKDFSYEIIVFDVYLFSCYMFSSIIIVVGELLFFMESFLQLLNEFIQYLFIFNI